MKVNWYIACGISARKDSLSRKKGDDMANIDFSGNMVENPELKYSGTGVPYVNFRVADNFRKKNNATGQWEDAGATFWRCSAFNKTAMAIAENYHKGSAVMVKGTTQPNNWTDENGKQRNDVQVVVDKIGAVLFASNGNNGGGYPQQGGYQQPPQQAPQQESPWDAPQQGGYQQPPQQQMPPQQAAPQQPDYSNVEAPF